VAELGNSQVDVRVDFSVGLRRSTGAQSMTSQKQRYFSSLTLSTTPSSPSRIGATHSGQSSMGPVPAECRRRTFHFGRGNRSSSLDLCDNTESRSMVVSGCSAFGDRNPSLRYGGNVGYEDTNGRPDWCPRAVIEWMRAGAGVCMARWRTWTHAGFQWDRLPPETEFWGKSAVSTRRQF